MVQSTQYSVGRLDMVVVAEMDNLSQDVGWLLLMQAQFETEYGVSIVSAAGGPPFSGQRWGNEHGLSDRDAINYFGF